MRKTYFLTFFLLLCVSVLFSSCGSQYGVPDDYVMYFVEECEYADSDYESSTQVIHSFNEKTHMDSTTVVSTYTGDYGSFITTCEAVFQYDRTSDLWSLVRRSEWSDPEYKYSDSLVGKWNVGSPFGLSGDYLIEIISVSDDMIELRCTISKTVYDMFENAQLNMSKKATVDNSDEWIMVPIELPEHFFVYENGYPSGSNLTDLCVHLDIDKGVTSADINDILYYLN